ncbi:MAG: hypothetical protein Unbinned1524contig1003_36 [Prokaryotic dsDNA virus sp.]|nr:MAG: hypothetical protein Unbinned1524contig1003_36 [Prokaryotic dsDNA virus sp.]|tara:strand:- start:4532 stop:5440 length:909 start_codon:yes stop_codon:yes gene_type:complete
MAETDTGVAQGGLGKIIGDAVIAFNHTNVMLPLVTSKQAVKGAITVQFPDYTKVASSSVAEVADGVDEADVTSITTAARSCTVSEHVIRADVTDLARMGNADDLVGNVGQILGNAVAAKLDDDLVELGKTFSQTECGAASTLALSHIFGSMRQLRAAGAPFPYNLVLSPKQVWGGKGLISLTHNTALDTAGSSTTDTATARSIGLLGSKGEEAINTGMVGNFAGFNVYWSDQIDEDVSSGGDAAGFAFSKGAVGLAIGPEGLIRIETERNASFRSTEYVAVGFWGQVEIKDAFGVYILSDVS